MVAVVAIFFYLLLQGIVSSSLLIRNCVLRHETLPWTLQVWTKKTNYYELSRVITDAFSLPFSLLLLLLLS